MAQAEEDMLWGIDRERERRGMPKDRPVYAPGGDTLDYRRKPNVPDPQEVLKETRPAKTESDSPHPNETDVRMKAEDMQRMCMWRLQSLERMAEAYGAETGSDRYMDIMAYRSLTALLDGRIGTG